MGVKKAFCCIVLLWGMNVLAQQRLEIISLQYRLPEQVLPTLQSLIEPGGSISGAAGKLFVRTSPANLAQIRRALEALDTPVRRLMISVRQGGSTEGEAATLVLRVAGSLSAPMVCVPAVIYTPTQAR